MDEKDNILRLNKFIAHCGICNRKQAVDLIKKGEIRVNDSVELHPFYELKPEDKVYYKNKWLTIEEKKVYLLLNKPANIPFSSAEDAKKPTVYELLKKKTDAALKPILPMLDDSCGLMVLTNDSELISRLSEPTSKVKIVYELFLDKPLSEDDWTYFSDKTQNSVNHVSIAGISNISTDNQTILGLETIRTTDKDVKSLFENKGYSILKTDITSLGGLNKKDLKRGWSRFLTEKEVIFLKYFN